LKPSEPYTGLGLRSHGKGTFLKEKEDPANNAMDVLFEVKRDDLIVNITFAWEGAIAIAGQSDEGALVSHRFPTYAFDKRNALPEFFRYRILEKQFVYNLGVISPGGAGRNRVMSKTDFLKLKVLLPNTDEQQKIADCLASVDALIEAQGRQVEALKAHKKGLLQQLFPQEGETQPRLRFPEFEGAGEWSEAKLVAACNLQAGKFVAASEIQEHSIEGLFPCYGGNGLRGYTTSFTHSGRYPLIGRQGALCGNVKFAVGKFHATEHAVVASPKKRVCVDWLFYLLDHLDLNKFATGQAQPGLSVDVLNNVMTSIPQDEAEQQRIADCLTSLDDLIAAETRKLNTLKTHKKGLMQQLFPHVGEGDA
jgi:type I restriction enzyme S subunit